VTDGPRLTGKACRYCGESVPWNPRETRARNLSREFCAGHQSLWVAEEARRRRAKLALTDPARAAKMEKDSKPNRRLRAIEREAAAKARPAARSAPRPRVRPPEPAPGGVTPLMWRLASAGETERGCLLAGLTSEQAARVMALQRSGARATA
jgi:hypothetical protein